MDNLVTLCSVCHPQFERIARGESKRTSPRRKDPHGAPFRGPDGQPWSRQWYEY